MGCFTVDGGGHGDEGWHQRTSSLNGKGKTIEKTINSWEFKGSCLRF